MIQAQQGLSDNKAESLINDWLSFRHFLDLGVGGRVPDAKTIRMFRERLIRADAIDYLFRWYDAVMRVTGYIAMSGQPVDSLLMAAPRQCNARDEEQAIQAGKMAPETWPNQPAKAGQKDMDARWMIQTGKARSDPRCTALWDIVFPTFGYKAHSSIDRRYRLIRCGDVIDASRLDGRLSRQACSTPRIPVSASKPTRPIIPSRTRCSRNGTD